MEMILVKHIKNKICDIYNRKDLPDGKTIESLLDDAVYHLLHENEDIRPLDEMGLPGGLIYLDIDKETIIVPDIHGRIDFLVSLLFNENSEGKTILDRLGEGCLQIICVGDGMHSESRAAKRWIHAKKEFMTGYKRHNFMDEEMRESLGVMEIVFELKRAFPESFHYLKGNHDNIANEEGNGNYPFMKFAFEGPMVTEYLLMFYGIDFIKRFYAFEKNLPVLGVGNQFLVSHAEPVVFFKIHEVLNYRQCPHVIEGLTWTDDDCAEPGSVEEMLHEYIDPFYVSKAFYFGGHRPVENIFNSRGGGRYIQIHNPFKFIIASISPYSEINLYENIYEIENLTRSVLKR